jgi:hypothetical protein
MPVEGCVFENPPVLLGGRALAKSVVYESTSRRKDPMSPTALSNGQRSPKRLLADLVRRLVLALRRT